MTHAERLAAYRGLVGSAVAYILDGVEVFRGVVEYVTEDLWAGIRQGGRLDEAPVQHLQFTDNRNT
jgi:hypothetical protein